MSSERQAFLIQARAQLELYRTKLDELRAAALQAGDDVRMHYHARVAVLQSRLSALQGGMKDLERVPDESWQKLRRSVEQASREFDHSLAEAMSLS